MATGNLEYSFEFRVKKRRARYDRPPRTGETPAPPTPTDPEEEKSLTVTEDKREYGQASRPISTGRLHALLRFHLRPINLVVYQGPLGVLRPGRSNLEVGFPLRCFQRLSGPNIATRRCAWRHNRNTRGSSIPVLSVLGTAPLKSPTPTTDRDQTVSRRFKPSSRTALIGEQPNPWDLLQPQDAMSRHRGAKPSRRCELLGKISLLSPAYLLSDERRPFHTGPPDH